MIQIEIEGKEDPKPFKVYRLGLNREIVNLETDFGTEAEAIAYASRRLDRIYEVRCGNKVLWPKKTAGKFA